MSDIRKTTPEELKAKLRKERKLSGNVYTKAKYIVYGGANGKAPMGACSQFNTDVELYGMWEALLYVEKYEEEGYFEAGTAGKVISALS